jgi:microcystin synthetase protein McyG
LSNDLEALATAYALDVFRRAGLVWETGGTMTIPELAPRLGRLPSYHRLLERILNMMVEDGLLEREEGAWRVIQPIAHVYPAPLAQRLIAAFPEFASVVRLLRRCGESLLEALTRRREPLTLLFADGSLAELEQIYQETPLTRVCNDVVAEAVARATVHRPANQPLRILEIGAGTGATTAAVLPRLRAGQSEYVFTDVSKIFLRIAQKKFTASPFVRYQALDIEIDPEPQGFTAHTFDVVLAASVLHATADLRRTLGHVRKLLAPGGLLVLLEGTRRQRWSDLTFGLTEGWWKFADTDLRPDYPLLSASHWLRLLDPGGFVEEHVIPSSAQNGDSAEVQVALLARTPSRSPQVPNSGAARRWLLIAEPSDAQATALVEYWHGLGEQAVLVAPDASGLHHALQAAGDPWHAVLYLAGAASADDTPVAAGREQCEHVRVVLRYLLDQPAPRPKLWVVTRGAQAVTTEDESLSLHHSIVWGLGIGLALERPDVWGDLIDLASNGDAREDARLLLAHLNRPAEEDEVALRGGRRLARRLRPASQNGDPKPWHIHADGSYLITGGLGSLGRVTARWLVDQGARYLILIGRHGLPQRSGHPPAGDTRAAFVHQLEQRGAHVEVVAADVSDTDALGRVLQRCGSDWPALRGVIHLAAAVRPWSPTDPDAAPLDEVLAGKAAGAWALHRLTRDLPLDLFVLYSSSTGVLGSKGAPGRAVPGSSASPRYARMSRPPSAGSA